MIIKRLLVSGLVVLLFGCKADNLVVDEDLSKQPTGVAAPLSSSEYQNLKPVKQYQVANKLAATLYKGIPVDEFFNFNTYGSELKVLDAGNQYLTETRNQVVARLKNRDEYSNTIDLRHDLGTDAQRAKAEPLSIITEYPVSRTQFEAWMAYVLMNTALFSPAEELPSTNYIDIQRIYNGLLKDMDEDVGIREIVLAQMKSEESWRRFRSPEDNTREMMEIYLGLFDRDEDVLKASVACKNWSLTDESKPDVRTRYVLVKTNRVNTEPQRVLGSWVETCDDFYEMVSNHGQLIPTITATLVESFFPTTSAGKRSAIVADIMSVNPTRFHDIFTAIIFSREYLLNNERLKNFEEIFFNLIQRTKWKQTNDNFLRELASNSNNNRVGMREMRQPTMTMKLGRVVGESIDPLSFAYIQQTVREQVLTRVRTDWGSWEDTFIGDGDLFSTDEYIHYLFLTALSRQATVEELDTINQAFIDSDNESGNNFRENQASIVFDYISRLPDLYYLKTITIGEAQ